jgi:hypothetical protein
MAIVVTRSESQLSATGAFQAMDNIGTASVSSSFTVPQGVSAIKQLTIAVSADGSEEFVPLVHTPPQQAQQVTQSSMIRI